MAFKEIEIMNAATNYATKGFFLAVVFVGVLVLVTLGAIVIMLAKRR